MEMRIRIRIRTKLFQIHNTGNKSAGLNQRQIQSLIKYFIFGATIENPSRADRKATDEPKQAAYVYF